MQRLKYSALRLLAKARIYANTEQGERRIVNTLTAMTCALAIIFALLIA